MEKKILFIVILIIIVVAVISFNVGAIINKKSVVENEESNEYCTYLIYNSKEIENEELDATNMIFAFNKESICIDCRMVWTFSTEEIAKKNYENWKKSELPNLKIENTTVSFNADEKIGKTKDEIKNTKFGDFEVIDY